MDKHPPMPQIKPIDVWDSRDYRSWWNKWNGVSPDFNDAIEWALENIPDLNYCYRIEFYVFDTAFCRVFRYAKGFDGKLVVFPPTGEATKCDPVIQIVSTLPFKGWRKPELALHRPAGYTRGRRRRTKCHFIPRVGMELQSHSHSPWKTLPTRWLHGRPPSHRTTS